MMRQRVAIFLVLAIGFGLIVTACGGGGSNPPETVSPTTTPIQPTPTQTTGASVTPAGTEPAALQNVEEFFQNPPDFTVDLSEKTIEDAAVPSADMNIPNTETGSLDIKLNIDSNIDVSVPTIGVPSTSGLLTSPGLSMPSITPTSTPSPTATPGTTTTATPTNSPTSTDYCGCSQYPEPGRSICLQNCPQAPH